MLTSWVSVYIIFAHLKFMFKYLLLGDLRNIESVIYFLGIS